MAILGINISGFHSSACIVVDGEIKAGITEERISRVKQDKNFPTLAITHCCEVANIDLKDITDIYIGWNPAFYINKSDNLVFEALQNRGKMAQYSLNELSVINKEKVTAISQELQTLNSTWKVHFVNHHSAHLCNSFLLSGFKEADFFIADGFGEHTTGMTGTVNYKDMNVFSEFRTPHSLGSFYSTFTEFLGFKPNGDEWKVMALASLGNPENYYEKVKSLISVNGLSIELDLSYFEHFLFFTEHYYSQKFVEVFGKPLSQLEELKQEHYDIVAAVQKVAEDVSIELATNLHKKTKSKNLVVSGGFFMNSVLNGKMLDKTPYEDIFIGGSPDDSGISIGAALYGVVFDKKEKRSLPRLNHNYFGAAFTKDEIIGELEKRKIKYEVKDSIEEFTAQLLRDGHIVGWFQGRSEFGQRALGNRSILADPTQDDVKDKINSSIKYRESFRPFAPSVLEEKQNDFFIIPKNQDSHFMEKVFMFKESVRDKLPGVVHFDGSGRIQTVSSKSNPRYHTLISAFEKLSGFPILLNTSFNINGMPLVENPGDAIDCFYKSGIDYLIMDTVVVHK